MHEFSWEDNGVHWMYFDTLTRDSLVHASSEIVGDSRFDQLKYIIVDLTRVRTFDLDEEDARGWATSFAIRANPPNPHVKVAFIAHRRDLCELVRAYIDATREHLPHANQKLFADEESARSWVMAS